MSLGQELAPHLPFLRRFARALLGSQAEGDQAVRLVLERIVDDPTIVADTADIRTGLYKAFHEAVHDPDFHLISASEGNAEGDDGVIELDMGEKFAQRRLQRLTDQSREALLLTSLEGFSSDDVAVIMSSDPATVDNRVAEALQEIERNTRTSVLIVEDEPVIALDLATIVRDLGHEVAGIASTKREAIEMAGNDVGLVLMDIQLADGYTGIEAALEIQRGGQPPIIFITAFPERLLAGPRSEPAFLITKPFQRSTVKAAIAQALFFDAAAVPTSEPSLEPSIPTSGEETSSKRGGDGFPSNRSLSPRPAPIYAQVTGSRLTVGPEIPGATVVDDEQIEAVRQLHRETAIRVASSFQGSNVGLAAVHRINAIAESLDQPLDAASSVRLGVQVSGFARLLPGIEEVLDTVDAEDVRTFCDDLLNLVRQFPAFREFQKEAARDRAVGSTGANKAAITEAVREIAAQPTTVVEPKLSERLNDLLQQQAEVPDKVSEFALEQSLGNIWRAIGRWLKGRAATLGTGLTSAIDRSLLRVVLGLPMLAGATYLAVTYPTQFGWLTALIEFAKSLL